MHTCCLAYMKITDPLGTMLQANTASEGHLNLWPWLMFKELFRFKVKINALDVAIISLSSRSESTI